MSRRNIHVTPRDGGWAVKHEGAKRAGVVKPTQQEAWNTAKRMAIKERAEAYLHGKDNRIRERNSYFKDPFPPRG